MILKTMKPLLAGPISFRLIAVIAALGYLALSALFLRVLGFWEGKRGKGRMGNEHAQELFYRTGFISEINCRFRTKKFGS